MGKGLARLSTALVLSLALFAAGIGPAAATPPQPPPFGDQPTLRPGTEIPDSGTDENFILLRDEAFIAGRTAGDNPLTAEQAGDRHGQAADDAEAIKAHSKPSGVVTFNGAWAGLGPNPIVQIQRSDGALAAESGRIGALAIRKNGRFILGAAQGGIWTFDGGVWVSHTDSLPSLAIGALAVAPSNDLVVYAGTGEGALSGDSYFGNGILKSTDGGTTWSHVSGDFFRGVATSRLAIDPTNANHLYASILRGRGGAHRTSPPIHSAFGVWESKDGGVSWTLLMGAPAGSLGATELRIDPLSPNVLYTSFWSDKIYKSTDGGQHWAPAMNGLPNGNFAASATRFSIGLSHPSGMGAVLYTGFDWFDAAGAYHQSHIFKSTDNAASWAPAGNGVGIDSVVDYCGQQCFYDNVIEADPQNPNEVFVAGQFGYGLNPPSGGVFRSDDGGASWINLGWDMHPDFHAFAFDPNSPKHVLIGNDGGVWESPNRGGRTSTADKLSNVDWIDLNGTVTVDPTTGAILVLHRTNLQIAQFSSMQTVPQNVNRFWGGTQDNGTLRKSSGSQTWFDVSSGDGGMVQVDQTDHSACPLGACFVFGNYFGVQPYRFSDGGNFFTNAPLRNGINTRDRSEFYLPEVLNQQNTNQYFLGTYRLYRTDNAKAPSASDVKFKIISPDLTSGCTGPAPNGARNCTLTAIGIGGGTAVYTGSNDGLVYISPDAQTSDSPTWIKLDHSGENGNEDEDHEDIRLPARPVAAIAVDRSNYRIAYIAYNGFNAATPMRPGHVFKTTNGGQSFADITGNLPDIPVNSIVLDPSYPNTLYAGTDVGPFVTYNGGRTWFGLGTGFPTVAINQLDLDTYHRVIAAGTHGRGAWKIADTSPAKPALVLSKVDAGIPVGPASNIDYTITVSNIGNAAATGVRLSDPIPDNTRFVSADSGGRGADEDSVVWSGLTIPSGGKVSVHLRVKIDADLEPGVKSIVNDGFKARSAEGPSTSGSPTVTPIAPAHAVTVTPATQTDGAHTGQSASYQVTVSNRGFKTDSYNLSSSGGTYPVSFFNAACAAPMATTPALTAGQSTAVCVKVGVPASAPDSQVNTATVTATSSADATVSASASVKTIAVAVDTLVVDDDSATSGSTDVNGFYTAALQANSIAFQLWDLSADKNLPLNYLKSFRNVVWFTGNTFPAPIGPYEAELKAYLDGGGRIFISGQDLLDQTGGTTSFVHDYVHVTWDGSETQNDKATKHVHGVGGTLTAGITTVGIDDTVLGNDFMDEITPNGTAASIFTDDAGQPDGLQFSGTFKVVFIAFPFEEYGSAGDKAALMGKIFTFLTT